MAEQDFNILDILKHIKHGNIKAFEEDLQKYNIDINYDFCEKALSVDLDIMISDMESDTPQEKNNDTDLLHGFERYNDYTFLNAAILYKKYAFCKYILKKYYPKDSDENRALSLAVKTKDMRLFKLIRKCYENLNVKKETILEDTCRYNNFKLFKYMIEQEHVNPAKIDIWRYAVYGGSISIMKYLLNAGYFPKPKKLRFILFSAMDDGYKKTFMWIVKNLCKTPRDFTLAMYAGLVTHCTYPNIIQLFDYCLKHGANINGNINGKIKWYDPLLFEYVKNYDYNVMEGFDYLVKNGINLKAKDRVGRTIFEYIYKHYWSDHTPDQNIKTLFSELCHRQILFKHVKKIPHRIPSDPEYDGNGNLINNPYPDEEVIEE